LHETYTPLAVGEKPALPIGIKTGHSNFSCLKTPLRKVARANSTKKDSTK